MSTAPQTLPSSPQFPPTSRYSAIPTATFTGADGRTVVYLTRRFLPSPESFALLQFHTVIQGNRLDNIANQYLGDPLAFWRICDANNVMRPDELTANPGSQIRITLPQGIPAATHA
jgi:hypothetical protein